MAKDFGKAAGAKVFEDVAQVSAEKANVIVAKMIHDNDLLDYDGNGEDIRYITT